MTTPHPPRDAAPPSLFGDSPPEEHGGLRMLSGLDGRDAREAKPRARIGLTGALLGCALVLAIGGAGWWALLSNAASATGPSISSMPAEAPPGPVVKPPVVATAAPMIEEVAPPPAPAPIETVSLPPQPLPAPPVAAMSVTPPIERIVPVPPRATVAATPSHQPAAVARIQPSHDAPALTAQQPVPTAAVAVAPKPKPVLNASGIARTAGAHSDADVELLTAMVGHLENRNVVVTTDGPAGAQDARSTQTIVQLVRDCQKLGNPAAEQCRQQICTGYWGKAQACPAPLVPGTTAP